MIYQKRIIHLLVDQQQQKKNQYFSSDIGYLIMDSWFHLFSDHIYQHLAPT